MLDFLNNIKQKDPAKTNLLEIALCYPGAHAVFFHRISHALYRWKFPILPRFMANVARIITGIEIHPGATLGKRLFIDHGTGIVIGEDTVVGDDVTLYHGVTLGGSGKITHTKRHPTIGNNVIIGAHAQIIGNITIGEDVKIGPNATIVKDVEPGKVMVGAQSQAITKKSFDIEYFI